MNDVLFAFVLSFGVIFVAELGDKSQLMALTFATRYKTWPVLIGITIATSVVHLVSVAIGFGLGTSLPTGWIAFVAAIAFFGFGAWTLRGDSLSAEEEAKAGRRARSAIVAASVAFFLAELGDKTMLATITLATQHGWFGVWLGSTLGMVAADGLAIVIGRQLGRRLPEKTIRYGASALFVVFGVALLVDSVGQLSGRPAWDVVAGALDHHLAGWIALALGLVTVVLGIYARRWAHLSGRRRSPREIRLGSVAWWTRVLFGIALLLGLGAPLLVAADVIQPFQVFSRPSYVVVGAGVALLGVALLLASIAQVSTLEQTRGSRASLVTSGLYSRVRNPSLTAMVLATAGTLVMVPTALGVLATVLIVVAVQIQVRGVREPGMSRAFGEEYATYVARTGRFLPKVLPPEPEHAPGMPSDSDRIRVG
ncbi:MAG: TMEM165/GDT1 family protein [Pseudonocardia sp.]|nr:TMEM165/GDT1 family protein [Pseudonocardia sp.]